MRFFKSKQENKKIEASPKPAKGFLYWGAFLAIMGLFRFMGRPVSTEFKLLSSLSLVPSLVVCILWYRFSLNRIRRGSIPHLFGTILFAFGTFLPILIFIDTAVPSILGEPNPLGVIFRVKSIFGDIIVPGVLAPLVLILVSYFLHFRRKMER